MYRIHQVFIVCWGIAYCKTHHFFIPLLVASRSTAATICWLHQHLLHNVSIHRKYISLSVTINSPSVSTVLAIWPFSLFAGRPSLLLLVGFSLVTLGWLLVCCPWWIIIQWLYSDYPHLVACYILLLPCYYPSEELCVKYGEILHAMALSFAFSISERTSQSSSEKDAGGWWGMLPLCWNLGPSELLGHFVSFPKKTQKNNDPLPYLITEGYLKFTSVALSWFIWR